MIKCSWTAYGRFSFVLTLVTVNFVIFGYALLFVFNLIRVCRDIIA